MVKLIKDIDLIRHIEEYDYTIIPMNCYNQFGNGFVYKVKENYPYTSEIEKFTNYGDSRKLGKILEIQYGENNPKFIVCYITFLCNYRPDLIKDYLDYDALRDCIIKINNEYPNKNIACTMIGCSEFDGNGNKEKVLQILNEYANDINLYVYDYKQKKQTDEKLEYFKFLCFLKKCHENSYYEILRKDKRNKKLKQIKLKIIKENISQTFKNIKEWQN